jgi:hypothetical protein
MIYLLIAAIIVMVAAYLILTVEIKDLDRRD